MKISSFTAPLLSELFQPFQKPAAVVFRVFDDPPAVFFGAHAGNIGAAEAVDRGFVDHVAELCHLFEVVEEFFHRMPVLAAFPVMVAAAAYGEGYHEVLAGEGGTFGTVRKAMGKDLFHPVLDDGGIGIPVEGELEYNNIRLFYVSLFFFHVQVPAQKVQASEGIGKIRFIQCFQNGFIGQGGLQVRVAGND